MSDISNILKTASKNLSSFSPDKQKEILDLIEELEVAKTKEIY